MAKPDVEKSGETNTQINSGTECTPKQQFVEKANERPEWLPDGWSVDFRTRKSGVHMGSGYKCYIEPLNGFKFYSKPEVLRYLETKKDNSCTPKKEKKCPNTESPSNVVTEKSPAEDLPPGWIKEVKIRKNGNGIRKDAVYKDPVSGYVFRSKKEALRYLASGDIGRCAFRPRQIQDEDKLTPSPAAKRQKLKQSAPKQQLFAGKAISDKNSLELPDANSLRKGQDVNVQSGMMVASVPTGESVVEIHSLEDWAENLSEMNKISDPDVMQEKEHVGNMMENANEKNHSNPSKSKKKEFNVGHRFSTRLAGNEPVQLANNVINEQTLQAPKRNMRKSRTTLDADLENKSSHHVGGVPEIEHAHKMQQEVINTSNYLSEDQAVAEEQPNKLEADKIDDKQPEIYPNSNKSNNKREHHVPCRASKRLPGFVHELMNNSISCEKTPKYESKRSKDEINAELQRSEGGTATELENHAPINGESAKSKIPPITGGQLEKLRGEEMDDEKSEHQMSFAFHYSWSDPSLEYAINTLTGVLPVEDSVDTRPTSTGPTTVPPQTDIRKKSFDNVTGRSGDRDPQVRSNKSKKKKELKAPMRVSKRLAGLEPEVLPSERALEYATKKSCKEEPIATATQILSNGASDHLDVEEETKRTCHASPSLRTEVPGESSNKSDKSYDIQTVPKEQLQKVEAENIGDERSEPQLPVSFEDSWSDPCLEFAFKTLTGSLPFDAATDILPVITPDVNDPPNKELHGGLVMRTSKEPYDNSNQSQNKKELNMVSQPSELFPRQPESRTSSTSCENTPKFTTRAPYGDEGYTRNLDGDSMHSEVGNVTQLVHHSRNTNTVIHKEPLKENGQVLEGESIITEQPPLETETINHDNSESQFCASFMNSWSDPCLDFAFKTLTGVIPVDENLAGCFQQPANRHNRTDGGSMLPDFGSSYFSQNDIPFHYDIGVNSMPGPQSSMSSPFPPWEKASLQGCPEVDPQKQYSSWNNNLPSGRQYLMSYTGEQEEHRAELCQGMEAAGLDSHSFLTQGFYPQAVGVASFSHPNLYYHSSLVQRSYPHRQLKYK